MEGSRGLNRSRPLLVGLRLRRSRPLLVGLLLSLSAAAAAAGDCDGGATVGASLWPTPRRSSMGDGATPVRSVTIRLNASAAGAPVLEAAAARYGARVRGGAAGAAYVCYVDVASPSAAAAPQLEDFEGGGEAYALTATAAGAQIVAATVWGALRGLETLFQAVVRDGDAWCVAGTPLSVDDAPRFPWRGLLLDTARRFYPVAAILRQLDAMEASKLNVFHWHLTDSESVPVALAALPAAAAAGAFAPAATYDAAAVATVVAHAAARGIRVVPEFDTPAHAGGFFLSRPDLFCGDTYADAVLDPTQEAVYEFLDALYASSAALFPDDVLHVGGDEVSTKCWNASASVRAWLAARNATVASLYGYYEARAVAIAARAGRAPMAWDEAFADPVARAGLDPRRAIVHAWNGPGGSPVTSDPRLAAAVAAGFRAVSSHGFYLTAGDGVDADLVVKWEHLYDRDLAAPLGENGSSPLLLGAEAALWGEKIDHRTVDAVAWPRAAVFAARLWSPDAAFTPGNYTAAFRRLVVHRCRLVRLGVAATPVDEGAQKFDRRSPWLQCLS